MRKSKQPELSVQVQDVTLEPCSLKPEASKLDWVLHYFVFKAKTYTMVLSGGRAIDFGAKLTLHLRSVQLKTL